MLQIGLLKYEHATFLRHLCVLIAQRFLVWKKKKGMQTHTGMWHDSAPESIISLSTSSSSFFFSPVSY